MDGHHDFKIGDLHFRETLVAQDAGIGDEDVDAAERIRRLLDKMGDACVVRDGRAVGDRRSAGILDFL